jgi:rod shape-determining protein MreD
MRWVLFFILAYLVVVFQTTAGRLLMVRTSSLGTIGPDLTALVVVFVALHAQNWADVMLAAWSLGAAVDLTTAAGPGGPTVVGPMAIAYALTAGLLFRAREAFFRERALTQALLAWAFCLVAHGGWVTAQSLLGRGPTSWSAYGRWLGQAAALAVYTAALMPLAHFALRKCRRWLLTGPVGRGRRAR